jgi:xanthine dehydrogenase/oxidase
VIPISATTRTQPTTTLLEYLRTSAHLTGTKHACGEGGCGACTVAVTTTRKVPKGTGAVAMATTTTRALNSCLVPLLSMHGAHVSTVEAVGSVRDGLHPIQDALSASFASQCGFCTPGFVMSLFTAAVVGEERDVHNLQKCIDGNLCRCTGYRPIADAVRAIADMPRGLPDPTAPGVERWLRATEKPHSTASISWRGANAEWIVARSLAELLALKKGTRPITLVAGNSEIGVDQRFKAAHFPLLVDSSRIPELLRLNRSDDGNTLLIGANVNLTDLWQWLQQIVSDSSTPEHRRRVIRAIINQIYWFSGTSIRAAATLAGNIATASPISDLNPVWVALDATFVLRSLGEERRVPAADFFLGYRKTALRADEIIEAVHVPLGAPGTVVHSFKQSQRREDDIAIVTACLAVHVNDATGRVDRARFAYGGMAARTVRATAAEQAIEGRVFDAATFEAARAAMAQSMRLDANVPGGRPEYRLALAQSMLYKFWLHFVAQTRGVDSVPQRERSALSALDDRFPRGSQHYEQRAAADRPVGDSARHSSGDKQVTGEAVYTDDLPRLPNELAGALVLSKHAVGTLEALEFGDALRMPGVRGVYGAADVPGHKLIGDIVEDEPVFVGVGGSVEFIGQPLAIVVADTEEQARAASRAVRVKYANTADRKPLISIEEAAAANSFFALDHTVERGGVDAAMRAAPRRASGRVRIGGQEHFYFEPNVTLAQPSDGGEMLIFASTQNINKTQHGVASVLGLPMNKVTCQVRRIGGGFGGKETSNIPLSCIAAVAAHQARRPVRLVLQRDEDMIVTGKRHPFDATYTVGFDDTGRVLALDVSLVNNGGYSFDLSGPVVDRAIMHSDNAYYLPSVRVRGRIAKTNLPTNTAFRGFGGPQGMIVAEHWIEHIARELNVRPEAVRERNLYASPDDAANQERRKTHFNQVVDSDMPALWRECRRAAAFEERVASVAQFNAANQWRKRGLAMLPSKFGLSFTFPTLNQASALVHIYTDGSVLVNHGGIEMGQGLHTKVLQVAAHALRVPLSSVHLHDTSSAKIPNASPTAASVGSDLYGMATLAACEQLSARLAPYRARLGADAPMAKLAHAAWLDRVSLSAQGFYKTPVSGYNFETGKGTPFNYFTSGAACSEVEIDALTGDWRAMRTDIVMDVGTSINPAIDIGQIEGAFVQGQGWLTTEDYVFGGAEHVWLPPGRLFAPGPGSYKIPALDDIPRQFNVHLMKGVANARAVYSSRGVGEPPILLSASVLFALRDAVHSARAERGITGARARMVADAPLTSERIRMACVDQFSTDNLDFRAKGNF